MCFFLLHYTVVHLHVLLKVFHVTSCMIVRVLPVYFQSDADSASQSSPSPTMIKLVNGEMSPEVSQVSTSFLISSIDHECIVLMFNIYFLFKLQLNPVLSAGHLKYICLTRHPENLANKTP